jgi:hypothetical protein
VDSFMKCTEVAHTFGPLFTQLSLCIMYDKRGWATFWALFSQTHLVT